MDKPEPKAKPIKKARKYFTGKRRKRQRKPKPEAEAIPVPIPAIPDLPPIEELELKRAPASQESKEEAAEEEAPETEESEAEEGRRYPKRRRVQVPFLEWKGSPLFSDSEGEEEDAGAMRA